MTNEERLKKLEQLKELRALKEQQAKRPTGEFFDPNRYSLENIPSVEDFKNQENYKRKNLEDILLGMAGVSPSIQAKPIAQGLRAGGESMYKSAFKKIDQAISNYGKKPVSEVLFKKGIIGTSEGIFNKASKLVSELSDEQRKILQKIDESVPSADLDRALKPLQDKIDEFKISRDPVKLQAAEVLEEDLKTYLASKSVGGVEAPISPSQMSAMKSSAQKLVPKTAYSQEIGRNNPAYMQGKKLIGQGLKEEVERAAGQASPELQQQLLGVNTDLSALLSAGKALQQEAQKGLNKNFLTSVDPIVGALGQTSGMAVPALAAKKAADLSKTTAFRTTAGKGMYDLGNYGEKFVDPATAYSLWYFLKDKEQE